MKPGAYRSYMIIVLMVVLAFNYVDRLALGLLLQDIKADLNLSDTELGLLSGIAFALFYSIMGIPIARWADRGNRVTIVALSTALWSAAMALCAVAGNFVHLLLIRVGVAIGEAGCVPPAHSLIADYFNRAERSKAVAIYKLGGPLSMMVGYFVAGWLNELYGWRLTFMLLGLPGLLLAAVAYFTLREPRVVTSATHQPANIPASAISRTPTLREVGTTLWTNLTFRHLLLAYSVVTFFGFGIGQWQAVFFIRSYGFSTGELGTWLALIHGGSGVVGLYLGAMLATRYAAGNERLQLAAMAWMYCAFSLTSAGIYLSASALLAFILMGLCGIGAGATIGPLFATIQTLVPGRMRAMSIAIILLFANLLGMGLGPLAAGALSDVFRPWAAEESLRFALLGLCPGYLWAAWHLWRASLTVVRDLQTDAGGELAQC